MMFYFYDLEQRFSNFTKKDSKKDKKYNLIIKKSLVFLLNNKDFDMKTLFFGVFFHHGMLII